MYSMFLVKMAKLIRVITLTLNILCSTHIMLQKIVILVVLFAFIRTAPFFCITYNLKNRLTAGKFSMIATSFNSREMDAKILHF